MFGQVRVSVFKVFEVVTNESSVFVSVAVFEAHEVGVGEEVVSDGKIRGGNESIVCAEDHAGSDVWWDR